MGLKLSDREKKMVIAAAFALVFLFYWYLLLNPLLASMRKTGVEIAAARTQLEQVKTGAAAASTAEMRIYPREEQLGKILKFMDEKCKLYGIELISLRETAENNKLTMRIKFKSTYYQLLGLLNSLAQLHTLILIDKVTSVQEGSKLMTEMTIMSGYL